MKKILLTFLGLLFWANLQGQVVTGPLTAATNTVAIFRNNKSLKAAAIGDGLTYDGSTLSAPASGGDVVADASPWTPGQVLVAGATDKHAVPTNAFYIQMLRVNKIVVTNEISSSNLLTGSIIASNRVQSLWKAVTPDGTNAVLDLNNGPNFYYTLSTSNYITFSNLVVGAQGAIQVFCNGTPRQINWSSSYDNYSTNEIAPVFTITNRAWIAYAVTFGTGATNVCLGIKRK